AELRHIGDRDVVPGGQAACEMDDRGPVHQGVVDVEEGGRGQIRGGRRLGGGRGGVGLELGVGRIGAGLTGQGLAPLGRGGAEQAAGAQRVEAAARRGRLVRAALRRGGGGRRRLGHVIPPGGRFRRGRTFTVVLSRRAGPGAPGGRRGAGRRVRM